ncbi:hypothetical protein [Candidatus Leptofilum sp.]|uniref:hypothetical protein n=1 Tax=Candidatus Leptofilum sp. TaxID=3241576 RepID=UPI003B5B0E6F
MKLKEIQDHFNKLDDFHKQLFLSKLIFECSILSRSVYPEAREGMPQATRILIAMNENILSISKQLSYEIKGAAKQEPRLRLFKNIMESAIKNNSSCYLKNMADTLSQNK